MHIFVISDNVDTCTGLRLAGITGTVVHTREELLKTLDIVKKDEELGILLIAEKLSNQFSEEIKELRMSTDLPLIVEIPDRHGSSRESNFIESYIREAIGIKVE